MNFTIGMTVFNRYSKTIPLDFNKTTITIPEHTPGTVLKIAEKTLVRYSIGSLFLDVYVLNEELSPVIIDEDAIIRVLLMWIRNNSRYKPTEVYQHIFADTCIEILTNQYFTVDALIPLLSYDNMLNSPDVSNKDNLVATKARIDAINATMDVINGKRIDAIVQANKEFK